MRPTFIVFFLLLSTLVSFAQETSPKALYDQGKYQEALESLQQSGLQNASDYYNAGNCLYRLGRHGQALAYFRKANALAPRNEDIRYNLKLVEAEIDKTGATARDSSLWSGKIAPFLRQVPEEFFDLLLALVTAGLAFLAYRARKKSVAFMAAVVSPEFLMVLGVWSLTCAATVASVLSHSTRLAAVVADVGVARSGPNESFTELFKLPAGTTVELTGDSREGWRQVRFSLGNVGWIVEKDLLSL